jgi:predicted dienelactone hydrolase
VNVIRHALRESILLLAAGATLWVGGNTAQPLETVSPDQPGPCAVSSQTAQVNGDIETYFYYPSTNQCGNQLGAPYPAVVLAHGFGLFGIIDEAATHAGNGEHLASWGYVVAIPRLPDNVDGRIADVQDILSYLQTETGRQGSFLHQKVDVDRLALVGHSFGGATVLAVTARDSRVKAVVAMDPVYHQGGPFPGEEPEIWGPDVEGPQIHVPTCIIGAPASNCNSEGDYAEIYPYIGATHKASLLVVGASHCDFMDPGNPLCYLICGGEADPEKTRLIQKYTTAWFNYYLHLDTDSFAYLYGAESQLDVAAGRIEPQVDTAPKSFVGSGLVGAAALEWDLYDHPIVAGYNIYRRLPGEPYLESPYAQVGSTNTYVDISVVGGQDYLYTVRSHDPAGNQHEPADEVSITVQAGTTPTVTVTATPTASATPMATPTVTLTRTPAPFSVYLPIVLIQ